MPTRRRVLVWLGAVALIAGSVITLRVTDDSLSSGTESDGPRTPVTVERFAADNVVLPAEGREPAPPARVVASPERGALRVSWAQALPGGQAPAGAAGYEVRWRPENGNGTDRDFGTRFVATPDVRLDGLTDDRAHVVEVRSVDAFGQRSEPAVTTGTPGETDETPAALLTGLHDEFTDPAAYGDRWHLAGYRGCVDVVDERGQGLPIELSCGADLAMLRARQPMTLTAPSPSGEVGRVAVWTDTAGTGGELTITLAPGPVDRVGADTQRANRFPPRDAALPGGTIRVGVDDGGVHVSAAPDVPGVAPPELEVFPAPVRGPNVTHLFEVVLTTSGLRVYQDGLPVAVAGVVPSWRSASVLLGFRGPERRRSRVHLAAAGFTGPASAAPPVAEVPVNAGTQRVLGLTEQAPQLGIARTPLRQATAARLVATLMVAEGMDPRGVVMQFGDLRVPARPVVAAPSAEDGAALTVVADVPAALLGAGGTDSITPFVLRAPGATQQVRLVETYLQLTPAAGWTPPSPALERPRPTGADVPPSVDAVLCNSAGEPLNSAVVPPRGQIVLKVDLDASTSQWATGTIGGVQGFEVWLDGGLIAGVPTRADGPGLGGQHALSIATGGLARGAHVLEVREYTMAGDERPVSAVLNFTVR
ncbi:hypothetical protein [Actinophytocola glycyrrhizae]|uniref:Fibronectin type-III domain-containing protein n=1 Tax=Actinophytocola glycyrrhizae TaxID=2044873 RepID=A0ABV9SGH5_9PSEU